VQIDRIQTRFDAAVADIGQTYRLLQHLEREVESLLQQDAPNEAAVLDAIERVEHVRYQLSKARTVMLSRMYLCMTSSQRKAFSKRFGSRHDRSGGRFPRF
jgi:Spy/CpxP family protein refolding chaperone